MTIQTDILTTFYKAMMDRVMSLVPEIKYFEMYNGQPDNEDQELPYQRPAVFMEFEPLEWKSLGNRVQEAQCEFRLYIDTETLSETSSLESDKERNAGLEHLSISGKVFDAVQGFCGDGWGTCSRTGFIPDSNHTGKLLSIMPFKTRLEDNYARRETQHIDAPALELTLVKGIAEEEA